MGREDNNVGVLEELELELQLELEEELELDQYNSWKIDLLHLFDNCIIRREDAIVQPEV